MLVESTCSSTVDVLVAVIVDEIVVDPAVVVIVCVDLAVNVVVAVDVDTSAVDVVVDVVVWVAVDVDVIVLLTVVVVVVVDVDIDVVITVTVEEAMKLDVSAVILFPFISMMSALFIDTEFPVCKLEIGTDKVPVVSAWVWRLNHLCSSVLVPSCDITDDPVIKPVSVACDVSTTILLDTLIDNWYSDTVAGLVIDTVNIQPVLQLVIAMVLVASWATAAEVKNGIIVAANNIIINVE